MHRPIKVSKITVLLCAANYAPGLQGTKAKFQNFAKTFLEFFVPVCALYLYSFSFLYIFLYFC